MTEKRIKKEIDKADIVSFDIFDTLVYRLVNTPSDIFEFVSLQYNSKGKENKIYNFKSERIKAEEKARKKSKNQEVTLFEIYENIKNYDNKLKNKLMDTEIYLEKNFIFPNHEMIELYKYAIEKGKKIIIISDMYLSKQIISEVLKRCGIVGYHKLFVSSEYGDTKASGKLFSSILKMEGVSTERWLHIGNDLKSDVINPRRIGIKTVLYRRIIDAPNGFKKCDYAFWNLTKEYKYKENYRKLISECNEKNKYDLDAYEFGYKIFGIFMLGYVKWLHSRFVLNNISNIFFFSREGYFIKKAYDFYFDDENRNNLKSIYMYVSRKSLYLPALTENLLVDDYSLFYPAIGKNVSEYLCSLGISKEDALRFIKKYDLNPNETAEILDKHSEKLKIMINKSNKSRLYDIESYLSQFDFSGNIAVVDVGWTGGMQIAFEKILADMKNKKLKNAGLSVEKEEHSKCYGYFIGQEYNMRKFIQKDGRNNPYHLRNEGWLFNYNDLTKRQKIIASGNEIFELIFDPNEGTVIGYNKTKESQPNVPILKNVEFSESYRVIELIQQGALDYIADVKTLGLSCAPLSNDAALYNFEHFLQHPDQKYVEMFGDIITYDSEMRGEVKLADKIHSKNPMILLHEFQKSYWKVGFLRRNFPYIRINYANLYYYAKKLCKK